MTQEEKEILLKDLCARLPYGVEFAITNKKTVTLKSISIGKFGLILINLFYKKPLFYLINEFGNIEYKPYLRPMSSMTEEEIKEFTRLIFITDSTSYGSLKECMLFALYSAKALDWLNKKMFDYRGLIPMGLALEAKEGMYS